MGLDISKIYILYIYYISEVWLIANSSHSTGATQKIDVHVLLGLPPQWAASRELSSGGPPATVGPVFNTGIFRLRKSQVESNNAMANQPTVDHSWTGLSTVASASV